MRCADVDLEAGTVWAGGGRKGVPRLVELTPWGVEAFVSWKREELPRPEDWACVDSAGDYDSRRSSVTAVLTEILYRAGLRGKERVGPRSIAAWAGRRVFAETGHIDAVMRALGLRSMDDTARLIGFNPESGSLI